MKLNKINQLKKQYEVGFIFAMAMYNTIDRALAYETLIAQVQKEYDCTVQQAKLVLKGPKPAKLKIDLDGL